MNSDQMLAIAQKVYDNIIAALCALLVTIIFLFVVFIVPKLPEMHAAAEAARILEIAAEHETYCEKLGMGAGTLAHNQCLSALQEFRQKVETRFAQENEF